MNIRQDIKSITELKIHPALMLEAVNKSRRPLVITQNGKARAVVQDVASFEATRKALLLLKLTAQAEADIKRGRSMKQADVFARMDKTYSRNG